AAFGRSGRLALTNYMFQAAVLDFVSSGYGLGWKLRPYVYVVAAVLLFSVEALFSTAWLKRFRFGPLEWVWRAVTHERPQPVRRTRAQRGLGSGGCGGRATRGFVSGQLDLAAAREKSRRTALARGKEPFAVILGCSDPRVPAELVFGQGFGDLFVIRVAGNIV